MPPAPSSRCRNNGVWGRTGVEGGSQSPQSPEGLPFHFAAFLRLHLLARDLDDIVEMVGRQRTDDAVAEPVA